MIGRFEKIPVIQYRHSVDLNLLLYKTTQNIYYVRLFFSFMFRLSSIYQPKGDQPQAIQTIVK